jgi:hypothetical protein
MHNSPVHTELQTHINDGFVRVELEKKFTFFWRRKVTNALIHNPIEDMGCELQYFPKKKSTLPPSTSAKVRFFSLNFKTGQNTFFNF